MQLSEMTFTEEASRNLSQMKGRTGLTPNILARIGFCLSLEDPTPPDPNDYEGSGYINIKRHVLTGNYDPLFLALLKERCYQDKVEEEQLPLHFKAHMNRGVLLLNKRLKSLDGLLLTIPPEFRQKENATDE
ncbi:MAG: DNA sulfur modification protein DndE [Anaerolineales bacterium]|nr:DNA sulfur modification protein DndE [Anaerolineales bacterium]